MSIDAIGPSLLANANSTAQDPRALFKQLSDSLSAGDLSGAQAAFQSLQQLGPQNKAANANSPFAALGQALQSGDLAGAQNAFAQLQAAHKGHHHHHHGAASETQDQPPPQPPTQALAGEGAGAEIDLTI